MLSQFYIGMTLGQEMDNALKAFKELNSEPKTILLDNKKEAVNYADLILISKNGGLNLVMEKICTKRFNGGNGADFGSAAGLHVDKEGKLHIWSSQKNATKQIAVSRFSKR